MPAPHAAARNGGRGGGGSCGGSVAPGGPRVRRPHLRCRKAAASWSPTCGDAYCTRPPPTRLWRELPSWPTSHPPTAGHCGPDPPAEARGWPHCLLATAPAAPRRPTDSRSPSCGAVSGDFAAAVAALPDGARHRCGRGGPILLVRGTATRACRHFRRRVAHDKYDTDDAPHLCQRAGHASAEF